MTRQEANIQILEKLLELAKSDRCRDLRFFQLLWGQKLFNYVRIADELYIKDNFHEESTETLNKFR